MKAILTLFMVFQASFAMFSQTEEPLKPKGPSRIQFVESPKDAQALASQDIADKTAVLYLQGGFAAIAFTQADKNFEKKYRVKYIDLGCVSPDHKIVDAYNSVIFEELSRVYGKSWQNEIRKGVIGFTKSKSVKVVEAKR
ncbi:hypothetical protein HUK80_15950 [Flavobacterium sp. MAH-1]|uniref:Uncharacterized protein n=1 Tax=Flavobacterium agri TaxID=2743471 RepID=A0A7Y9C8F4_9FLAO|nr:hypothetical protein [Flavobacterium agri]NUY82399.1 hypothetical protein [Flavobacterium agri]NYA72423.1 hypothetical protein [Flavobacterium agri]